MLDGIDIVDPHFHLIDFHNNPYPWLAVDATRPNIFGGRDSELRHVFLEPDYRRAAGNLTIKKAVHIQANWDPSDPVGETKWLAERIARNGFPTAAVAFANLASPHVGDILAAHAAHGFVRGIRHIVNWDDEPTLRFSDRPDYLTNEDWLSGFALLECFGLSFDAQLYHHQMDQLMAVAAKYPSVQIIINHTGMPIHRDPQAIIAWSSSLARIAEAPNVAIKISGLGLANPDWSADSIRPLVLTAIEHFGIDRAMFASNFPVEGLFTTFGQLYAAFDAITKDFIHEERVKLFQTNAERLYCI
ncbi:amidohydrolase family protein [Candidatus Protofrankia californiensis]|uniref:amidohydrolase family protein n=1 Tax=Candidatus Protofrankia californiensis TaxID=1839754 RepID=UPI0010411E56|nr:amidohydrolase family protein [Candidatus Protofrankia californiensis]